MKSLIAGSLVALTIAGSTVAMVSPASALVIGVGPRGGVHVGLGRPGWRGGWHRGWHRGWVGRPGWHRGYYRGRRW